MYPADSMLAQWTAEIYGTPEIVVGSLRFASSDGVPIPGDIGRVDNDNAAQQVLNKLSAFWQNPQSYIPTYLVIREFKWNRIGTDGRYVNPTTRLIDGLAIDGRAASGATKHAPQIAWATTWTTGVTRGRAHYGRTYWPTAVPLADNLAVTANMAQLMAINAAEMIESMGNWSGIDTNSVVPSVGSNLGTGAFRPITGAKVGRVLDTIRARRNKMGEDYQSS